MKKKKKNRGSDGGCGVSNLPQFRTQKIRPTNYSWRPLNCNCAMSQLERGLSFSCKHALSHAHMHAHSHFVTLTCTHTHSLSVKYTCTHTHSLCQIHIHAHTLSRTQSLSHTRINFFLLFCFHENNHPNLFHQMLTSALLLYCHIFVLSQFPHSSFYS